MDILKKLRLTDLALVSQTCWLFNYVSRLLIDRHYRNSSPFTVSHEFTHYGIPIDPDINLESRQAACFDETTNKLKILHLPTGLVVASSPEANSTPVSVKLSPNCNYVAASFDSKVCLYALDAINQKLFSCLEVSFDVPILDFIPPGHGRCREGMGRILVSFSKDDAKVAVAHISESSPSSRFLTLKCATTNISTAGMVGGAASDCRGFLQYLNDENSTTAHLKVSREFVSSAKICMNADPLMFLIPPGCVDECGFLFNPFQSSPMFGRIIKEHDTIHGSLITCRFSSCGNYYLESRKMQGQSCTVAISKYELDSGNTAGFTEVSVCSIYTILYVLISDDSNLAVILLGIITGDDRCVHAWYVANLSGEGVFYVHCQTPVCAKGPQDLDLENVFGLSYDGQLLSVLCDLSDSKRCFNTKVFETATGRNIDALSCAVPNNWDMMRADWPSSSRSACHHVFGGEKRYSLAMFTVHDYGASFSYATER